MQKISSILNVVLLIAVAVLYYLHFSTCKKQNCSTTSAASFSIKDSAGIKVPRVAYVELDSINANVGFIKQKKAELEIEQKVIATEYENAYRNLEAEKNNFLKKGNAITQQEAQVFQEKLMQKQQEVEATKQAKTQQLAEKGTKIMDGLQSKIKIFLSDYNKDKKYTYILASGTGLDYLFYKDSTLNITSEIVKGINEKMDFQSK